MAHCESTREFINSIALALLLKASELNQACHKARSTRHSKTLPKWTLAYALVDLWIGLFFTCRIFALQEGLHFMPKILVKNRAWLFSLSSTSAKYLALICFDHVSFADVLQSCCGTVEGWSCGLLVPVPCRVSYPDFPCPNYSNFLWQTLRTCMTYV